MFRPFALCVLITSLWPAAGFAADHASRALAATCTGCHGPNGASAGEIPSIAGMEKDRMVSLMQAFRDGSKPSTVMQQHARGYTQDQIDALADWFARQR